MRVEETVNSGRSISQILLEMVQRVDEIIRSEIHLATTEVKQDVTDRAKAAVFIMAAAGLILLAVGFLLLAAVYALSTTMASWMAALSIGVPVGIVGGILLYVGYSRMMQPPKLDMTTNTAEDNLRWIRNQSR